MVMQFTHTSESVATKPPNPVPALQQSNGESNIPMKSPPQVPLPSASTNCEKQKYCAAADQREYKSTKIKI